MAEDLNIPLRSAAEFKAWWGRRKFVHAIDYQCHLVHSALKWVESGLSALAPVQVRCEAAKLQGMLAADEQR